MDEIISVSGLNKYAKLLLENDVFLSCVFVEGEISNMKNHYSSGHIYMTLKDENSSISAVMFKSYADKLSFLPEDGISVIVKGRISIYERDGKYQFYIYDMYPSGVGALSFKFNQLKDKLQKEGLFDEKYKKNIPQYPKKIAAITSKSGAAIRDIINVLERRYPIAQLYVIDVPVQGVGAAEKIALAIDFTNEKKLADVIILGRGGGSVEDLWAFNEEVVARAVFKSHIPIISAVGHETDFTISDFVADLRAPTPSAAAELSSPKLSDEILRIKAHRSKIVRLAENILSMKKMQFKVISDRKIFMSVDNIFDDRRIMMDNLCSELKRNTEKVFDSKKKNLGNFSSKMDALSPLKVLSRGYGIATLENGEIITGINQIHNRDRFLLKLKDGEAQCIVEEVKK